MTVSFSRMRECQDKRVKMRFDDGIELVALLLNVSQDMDGGLHLVYDNVEWASDTNALTNMQGKALYSPGESLVSIDEIPPADA
jgi:hypothetical protein